MTLFNIFRILRDSNEAPLWVEVLIDHTSGWRQRRDSAACLSDSTPTHGCSWFQLAASQLGFYSRDDSQVPGPSLRAPTSLVFLQDASPRLLREKQSPHLRSARPLKEIGNPFMF